MVNCPGIRFQCSQQQPLSPVLALRDKKQAPMVFGDLPARFPSTSNIDGKGKLGRLYLTGAAGIRSIIIFIMACIISMRFSII